MNKSFIKRAAIVITAVSLASVPVFARTGNRNVTGRFGDTDFEPPCENYTGEFGRWGSGMMGPGMRGSGMGFAGQNQTMGTVAAVDKEKGIITITDVDGKDSNVHVSPVTRIVGNGPTDPRTAEIDTIKKGDWIMVMSFNTDTQIHEAARIFITAK